jgi:hypothetical protein
MTATARRSVRCAIYTRVSTESDLDQDFSSLDAQYDAANGFAERLIGSIRVSAPTISSSSARHICTQILQTYARYYNKIRTHRSLHKDAPISRPVLPTGKHQITPYTWWTASPLCPRCAIPGSAAPSLDHVLGNARLCYLKSELKQLTMNARCSCVYRKPHMGISESRAKRIISA